MLKSTKACQDDFFTLSVIGKGSHGKVCLVKKIQTGQLFALKIIKRKKQKKKRQLQQINTEKNILVQINHPFVVKLAYTFQNEKRLFFAMEYCQGGELFNLLCVRKKLTESQSKFYIAQIVLVMEELHKNDIVYRDLKPENVLIDNQGYIRIADFGLSKKTKQNNSNTICGTPEYLAPEILINKQHGKQVDWWTLGSILYELLNGEPAFSGSSRDQLFSKILKNTPEFPKNISDECHNFLECLLKKNPKNRLGSNKDAQEIKSHPWLKNIQWDKLLQKQIPAPFVPKIDNDTDLSHFNREFTEMPIYSMDIKSDLNITTDDQSFTPVEGFTWSRSSETPKNVGQILKEKQDDDIILQF